MRIPLDYYRILGVPLIKATAEQIERAYSDRLMQMPLRQYSDRAIASRQALIEEAYKILSVAEQRAEYDLKFLESSYPSTSELGEETLPLQEEENVDLSTFVPPLKSEEQRGDSESVEEDLLLTPTVEIAPKQIMGALLVLQDLGEYEQVLQIGDTCLNNLNESFFDGQENLPLREDLLLTLALAHVELSREQWQKGEYEKAASSGKMGLDLLTEENIFPSVREEIATDLCKLRPYRILELLAQSEPASVERETAFELLKAMLREREGIEGNGKDRSGLKCEQFLCFIQQLRNYLSAAEQEELFEAEAKRPSAVAAYITIYALIARGFAEKQPGLIYRAQQLIQSLLSSHDVYWEQAVCALLLGQVEIANHALLNSKEKEKISLVRQHTQNTDDLLPGLCFYGEQWLKKEVLSQFSELTTSSVTLKEYFADSQVQAFIEHLPTMKVGQTELSSATKFTSVGSNPDSEAHPANEAKKQQGFLNWGKKAHTSKSAATTIKSSNHEIKNNLVQIKTKGDNTSVATLEPNHQKTPPRNFTVVASGQPSDPTTHKQKLVNYKHSSVKRVPNKPFLSMFKSGILLIGLMLGIGSLAFLLTRILLNPSTEQADSNLEANYLAISLTDSLVELPSVTKQSAPKPKQEEGLTTKTAVPIIQQWLDSKSAAFGKEHNIDRLNTILTASLLSQWRDRATVYQKDNLYRTYQHTVKVKSVKFESTNPTQGSIEAEVREVAQHYQNQQLDSAQSYDDNLLVRYDLVRQNDQWLIKNIEVLKTL